MPVKNNSSDYQYFTLPNGIRLVHHATDSPVGHFCVVVNAGSRDEEAGELGLAHFIEHTIFKGTKKRRMHQVIGRLENVGADLNAFTTKEETCVFASFLAEYFERSLELLADIFFNSVFPEKELEKEKEVVLDEINSYLDNPAEAILDDFEEVLFPGHPLGNNVLGTFESVKSLTRSHIIGFMAKNYLANRIVLSSVGNIPFQKLCRLSMKYFDGYTTQGEVSNRIQPGKYIPQWNLVKNRDVYQAHMVIGGIAYNHYDENRIPLAVLTNILGGPAMNSRLSMVLREKHGIAYNLESNYTPLSDTGIFTIYLGADEDKIQKALQLIDRELKKVREQQMSPLQLHTACEQLKGQLALSVESHQNEMLSMGKSLLVYNKVDSIQEIKRKIDEVTSSRLIEVANQVLDPQKLSMMIYKSA